MVIKEESLWEGEENKGEGGEIKAFSRTSTRMLSVVFISGSICHIAKLDPTSFQWEIISKILEYMYGMPI